MDILYDKFNIPHKVSDMNAVETVFKLKEKSGSNPWPVIEKLLHIWTSKNPTHWQSYLYYLDETKQTRKVSAVGSGQYRGVSKDDRINDAITRYTIDMPQPLMYMIRMVYSDKELPMNHEFFAEFGRKFPIFKVMEKL